MLTAAKQILLSGTSTGIRTLTLANVITDATRRAALEGDGLSVPGGYRIEPATTNIINTAGSEASFEVDTTGWLGSGSNAIARTTARAKYGVASLECTDGGAVDPTDAIIASCPITLTAAAHAWAADVWIPADWDGGQLSLQLTNFAAATGIATVNLNMAVTDQWQRVGSVLSPVAGDLAGQLRLMRPSASPPTAGRKLYLDGAQIELGLVATPFTPTSRSAGRARVAVQGLCTATQGAVFTRLRMGFDSALTAATATFPRVVEWRVDGSNRISNFYSTSTQTWGVVRRTGAGTSGVDTASTHAVGDKRSVGVVWTATQAGLGLSGADPTMVANEWIPDLSTASTADLGSVGDGTGHISSNLLFQVWFKGVPTAADWAKLNAFGDTVPTIDQLRQLSAASKPTLLIPADTSASRLLPAYYGGTL